MATTVIPIKRPIVPDEVDLLAEAIMQQRLRERAFLVGRLVCDYPETRVE